ncbi:uncharacterized protein LOC132067960 [Lycium ferocissimum]|uniref:uncharacterized protein LOC132067960 n=1 Tax=Lycium ferocissimum TaxID=112874 RepID=UPI0028164585|nr:uncharacterized protein LOC132067960 [Lycium ferocissimum]
MLNHHCLRRRLTVRRGGEFKELCVYCSWMPCAILSASLAIFSLFFGQMNALPISSDLGYLFLQLSWFRRVFIFTNSLGLPGVYMKSLSSVIQENDQYSEEHTKLLLY